MAVDLSDVTMLLMEADLDYLLGFCDTYRIVVGADKRDSKPAVSKLVMRYLNSEEVEDSEDGGKAIVLKIMGELGGEEKGLPDLEDDGDKVVVDKKFEPVPDVKPKPAKIEPVPDVKSKPAKIESANSTGPETISYHKLQKFKLDGKIGDPEEKDCLKYCSVSYQIRQGILQNYSSNGRIAQTKTGYC